MQHGPLQQKLFLSGPGGLLSLVTDLSELCGNTDKKEKGLIQEQGSLVSYSFAATRFKLHPLSFEAKLGLLLFQSFRFCLLLLLVPVSLFPSFWGLEDTFKTRLG